MSHDVLRGAVPEDSEGIRLLDQAWDICRSTHRQATADFIVSVRQYVVDGQEAGWEGIVSDETLFKELSYCESENENVDAAIRKARQWLRDHARLLAWERMEKSH